MKETALKKCKALQETTQLANEIIEVMQEQDENTNKVTEIT